MNEIIGKLLLKTGAFKDLDQPVLLTSGEIGIYYVNTEKLVKDNNAWTGFGDSSKLMIEHAYRMYNTDADFKTVIDIIAGQAEKMLAKSGRKKTAISGGQRRDWLFSGPVAKVLGLNHISLYKQEDTREKVEILTPAGDLIVTDDLEDCYALHIVDLITEGSSIYKLENGKVTGWAPMLRSRGASIDTLLSVVTRKQGGEDRLKDQGIDVVAFVSIDEDFVKKFSKYPERAISYMKDPQKWSENYLKDNGALAFIEYFDPAKNNVKRAKNFLGKYSSILKSCGKYEELIKKVEEKYEKNI
jgi:orotate phosphoribosyltransferase